MNEYNIKISMTPHDWDNPNAPYFWVILRNNCNYGSGWALTPQDAWTEAFQYFEKYLNI